MQCNRPTICKLKTLQATNDLWPLSSRRPTESNIEKRIMHVVEQYGRVDK